MSGMISTATELGTRKLPDDPYKGLPYYEVGDEALFAGRDDDVAPRRSFACERSAESTTTA